MQAFPSARWCFALWLLVFPGSAAGHSWYSQACCNDRDCREVVAKEVERRNDGWFVITTQELVPFGDARIRHSMDVNMHVCLGPKWVGGKKSGERVRCLYIPDPGI